METLAKCDKWHDNNSECAFSMATSVYYSINYSGFGEGSG